MRMKTRTATWIILCMRWGYEDREEYWDDNVYVYMING